MHGHGLMQTIARVNRVFKDKPGGLVVDYIGIGADLKAALRVYTDAKGKGQPTVRADDGLHYLKDDGVMAIILPHGVLFRGGVEERIRTKLLKDGHIDTVGKEVRPKGRTTCEGNGLNAVAFYDALVGGEAQ